MGSWPVDVLGRAGMVSGTPITGGIVMLRARPGGGLGGVERVCGGREPDSSTLSMSRSSSVTSSRRRVVATIFGCGASWVSSSREGRVATAGLLSGGG